MIMKFIEMMAGSKRNPYVVSCKLLEVTVPYILMTYGFLPTNPRCPGNVKWRWAPSILDVELFGRPL